MTEEQVLDYYLEKRMKNSQANKSECTKRVSVIVGPVQAFRPNLKRFPSISMGFKQIHKYTETICSVAVQLCC